MWLAWLAAGGSGCESCDFSFGPIPLTVGVSPYDVVATVTVCQGDDAEVCQTLTTAEVTTAYGTAAIAPGTAEGWVSWDGYLTCRYPDLVITASAPGCEPDEVFVEGGDPGEGDPIAVELSLRCG
ncbi:MAG: hypothetical protein ABMA64_07425 [Myxococcota bacterium]